MILIASFVAYSYRYYKSGPPPALTSPLWWAMVASMLLIVFYILFGIAWPSELASWLMLGLAVGLAGGAVAVNRGRR